MQYFINTSHTNKVIFILFYTLLMIGCNQNNSEQISAPQIFTNIALDSGLDIVHKNAMSGHHYFFETMGPACALFDYDNDGDLDLYIGQGNTIALNTDLTVSETGRLYRNDLQDNSIHFTDVTESSGLISSNYSMGIAVGDINNDGYQDVYLTNFGSNNLYINNTDGTFKDITDSSHANVRSWSMSASFIDINNDNLLDLYVTNYVDYSIATHKDCTNETGQIEYCGPYAYPSLEDSLFLNLGSNKFQDISRSSGIFTKGAGLGVVSGDFNSDGLNDIYVTNDGEYNFLWINQGNETFINDSMFRGSAVNKHGSPEASMGVDMGDVDNDGDYDLFMTHLLNETNTLYLNSGKGYFNDVTSEFGLAEPSKGYTGFGVAFIDYDNDGWLDLLASNGEVRKIQQQVNAGIKLPLAQPNQLFNNQKGSFREVINHVDDLQIEKVSRGLAIGDIDNDGDTDVLISNINDHPQLLINNVGHLNNWIGLLLVGKNNKVMIGSKIIVTKKDGTKIFRMSRSDASFVSANDPRILAGLDDYNDTVDIEVQWSDGKISRVLNLPTNQYHKISDQQTELLVQ